MKKSELKNLLKPIIRECINEVIFKEGMLAGIIAEVTKGLTNANVLFQEQRSERDEKPQVSEKRGIPRIKQVVAPKRIYREEVDVQDYYDEEPGFIPKKPQQSAAALEVSKFIHNPSLQKIISESAPGTVGMDSIDLNDPISRNGIDPNDAGVDISLIASIMNMGRN